MLGATFLGSILLLLDSFSDLGAPLVIFQFPFWSSGAPFGTSLREGKVPAAAKERKMGEWGHLCATS